MTHVDVRVYEVGPRDGLQNESGPIPTGKKLEFIGLLADAGLREIEATSFVSPTAIPQLADADDLMASLERRPGVRYPVLVPNERGLVRAIAARVDAICVFTAASETFTRHNIGMSIAESLAAFEPVVTHGRREGWWIRGYLSTAFGCPYEGSIAEGAVVGVAERLLELGVDELSISDTIGVAGPADVRRVVGALLGAGIGPDRARHALPRHPGHRGRERRRPRIGSGYSLLRCIDRGDWWLSVCAPGAAGNLATEDLVYLLDREGMTHGIDLDAVLVAARHVSETLGRPLATKVGQAGGWRVP